MIIGGSPLAATPGASWPEASRTEERIGAVIAAAATLWMFLVAAWGIAGPFPSGHFASTAAVGLAGFNMWKYHIIYPVAFNPLPPAPSPGAYYMHHPLGIFWVGALFVKLLGDNDVAVRLPAVIYSTAVPFLLYQTGRAVWGPLAGACTAVAYASLPITLGFANFHAFEGPTIFGCVVAAWGYTRLVQTWRDRYTVACIAGLLFAVNQEWIAYLWGVVFLAWIWVCGFVVPRRVFGPVDERVLGRTWALLVGAALASLIVALVLIQGTGRIEEVISSHGARSSGNSIPLKAILEQRHVRIELMFTPVAIFLGKLALPIVVLRIFLRRNELEALPLPFWVAAVFQYVHFKQGADIHIFWSQYFAPYFALGVGALAATASDVVAIVAPRVGGRWGRILRDRGKVLGTLAIGLPVLFVLQDGARTIRLARETGGRFVEGRIDSDIDMVQALRWFTARVPPDAILGFHSGISNIHWSLLWEAHPHPLAASQPVGTRATRDPYYFLDTRAASSADLKSAVSLYHVQSLDHFWYVDRREAPAPLTGYRFDERDPSIGQSFLYGATEPVRKIVPDPWATWEWRTLLGQAATAPAGVAPASFDQRRIAYNQALAAGDRVAAAARRKEVEAAITDHLDVKFDNDTRLLGLVHHRGAQRSVTLLFEAGDFKGARADFRVRAKVVRAPRFSTLPLDPTENDISYPPPIPTDLWRRGQLYAIKVVYRKRPGTEELTGAFVSLDGRPAPIAVSMPAGRARAITLIRL